MVPLSTLDPRAPLVFDTRELGRRPGAIRRVNLTAPAPPNLSLGGVVAVPEGADIELDIRLESVLNGVLVTGSARAPLLGECVRCLEPVDATIETGFQELYAYADRGQDPGEDGTELVLAGDVLDLEHVLRDAVVLALPQAPLCRDDCPGLCAQCGVRLADDPRHVHESTDPRWAALTGLLAGNDQEK